MRHSRNSKPYRSLAAWLKKKRIERGLSIRTLAESLDVPYSIIAKIETGARKLDSLELVEYCLALSVDPKEAVDLILDSL